MKTNLTDLWIFINGIEQSDRLRLSKFAQLDRRI